jgi:hypothetical protein
VSTNDIQNSPETIAAQQQIGNRPEEKELVHVEEANPIAEVHAVIPDDEPEEVHEDIVADEPESEVEEEISLEQEIAALDSLPELLRDIVVEHEATYNRVNIVPTLSLVLDVADNESTRTVNELHHFDDPNDPVVYMLASPLVKRSSRGRTERVGYLREAVDELIKTVSNYVGSGETILCGDNAPLPVGTIAEGVFSRVNNVLADLPTCITLDDDGLAVEQDVIYADDERTVRIDDLITVKMYSDVTTDLLGEGEEGFNEVSLYLNFVVHINVAGIIAKPDLAEKTLLNHIKYLERRLEASELEGSIGITLRSRDMVSAPVFAVYETLYNMANGETFRVENISVNSDETIAQHLFDLNGCDGDFDRESYIDAFMGDETDVLFVVRSRKVTD